MPNIKITDLPAAQPLTGAELVPIVQDGITVRTTTSAVAGSPAQQQTFVTVDQEPTLPNSRALQAQAGIGITDGGPQGPLTIALNGASASLETAGNGFVVKTAQTTITPRALATGSSGIAVANGDGQAGNPTFSLTGQVLALANASGDGLLGLRANGTVSLNEITGTTAEIAVANGTGAAGNPTIGLADNPIVPGTESLTLPTGTLAERPVSSDFGMIRANSTTGEYEVYYGGAWTPLATAAGILRVYNNGTLVGVQNGLNFVPGTGMTYSAADNPGQDRVDVTQGLANTGVTAASYGSASAVATFTVNAQGQLTTAATTSISIAGSQITSGTVAVANGGTGANNATTARANLSAAVLGANNDITSMSAITGSIASPTYIQMDNGNAVTLAAGRLWYTPNTGAWNLGMGNGNITQQVGEEVLVYGKASAAITDSPLQIVYQTGTVGGSGVITFAPTVAGITDGMKIIGVATESLAHNDFGRVTSFGVVHNITTDGAAYGETWADGDTIWYNPVTGNPTKVKPVAPNIKVAVGVIIKAGAGGSGSIQVELNHGSVLGGTDSNVQFSSLVNGDLIAYDSGVGYWKNVTQSTIVSGTATNLAGGATGSVPYQSGASTTTFLALGTADYVLVAGATAPKYAAQSTLSVGSATTATNIAAGATGSVPYQSGAGTTTFLALGTTNYVMTAGATGPQYVAQSTLSVGSATNAVNIGVTDDTATATSVYPAWVSANTGNLPAKVTSTKLSFVPSTGVLTVTGGITGGTF